MKIEHKEIQRKELPTNRIKRVKVLKEQIDYYNIVLNYLEEEKSKVANFLQDITQCPQSFKEATLLFSDFNKSIEVTLQLINNNKYSIKLLSEID